MKISLRTMLLVSCLVIGMAINAPAFAKAKHHHKSHHHAKAVSSEMVRTSQMRLEKLGYFAGPDDGLLGPATRSAIKGFQKDNKLPVTGSLTSETYDTLVAVEAKQTKAATISHSQQDIRFDPHLGGLTGSHTIPVRYGELTINDKIIDNKHSYSVVMNGHAFISEENQPSPLQVSLVYQLKDEDAVVITAYRGEENCAYKNYLVIVHSNGTDASTHEFESCAPSNEVHQAFNALFVRFAGTMNPEGYDSWDVWRYENNKLMRM